MRPTLLGIPWDGSSSFQRGPALAPPAIRAALRSDSTNGWNESLQDARALLADAGDLPLDNAGAFPLAEIELGARRLVETGAAPIFLGGDHSISWPLLRAVRARFPELSVLHIDAHPDLYDDLDGNRESHACPLARALEEGLVDRLVQVGIRTLNPHQQAQSRRYRTEIVPMRDGVPRMLELVRGLAGPVYLTLDLDGLDPAFVPGISHPEPGGLSTREALTLLQAIPAGALIGADLVELNPLNDLRDLTARVAAKLIGEIVGKLAPG